MGVKRTIVEENKPNTRRDGMRRDDLISKTRNTKVEEPKIQDETL